MSTDNPDIEEENSNNQAAAEESADSIEEPPSFGFKWIVVFIIFTLAFVIIDFFYIGLLDKLFSLFKSE